MHSKEYLNEYTIQRRNKWRSLGLCTGCGQILDKTGRMCSSCLQKRRDYQKIWRAKTDTRKYFKKIRSERKLKVLQKVSGLEVPKCRKCGCSDLRVLEINHKNGNGNLEFKGYRSGYSFYNKILTGERLIVDLEVLCKVCNAEHYCSLVFGLKWDITFSG
jgi:hypothetical protein